MQDYQQAVFISYAWGGEREEIVNQVDEALQKRGIKIVRDKRNLGYKGFIREFMERIGQGNCVIVVISDKYLHSPNCMYELVEIAENKQFHDRIFPIVLADANIYDPVKRIDYVKHWELKREELAEAIKTLDPANLQGIREDMDLYDRIRDKVSGLTSILKDMNTLTPEMHQDSNFSDLFDAIEKRMTESPGSIADAPAEAVGGLVALGELMQHSPEVRNAVIEFQTDFKVAREQVDQLGDYKDLHDLLHKVQYNCFNGIVHAATRFTNDDLTLDELSEHFLTLENIVGELKQISSRPTISKQELKWVEGISSILFELRTAIDTLDEKMMKKVIWDMNRLLAIQPARINTLLNQAARNLRLPALKDALARIHSHLNSNEIKPHDVENFKSGVVAFGTLDQALNVQVENHDNWQSLDVELRQIEATLDLQLSNLEMYWPVIKSKADSLYISNTDEWAKAIKHDSDNLDEALASNNPAKVKRAFRDYQRRVNYRFYLVDKELKKLCGNLRQIGVPLDSVLRMIQ